MMDPFVLMTSYPIWTFLSCICIAEIVFILLLKWDRETTQDSYNLCPWPLAKLLAIACGILGTSILFLIISLGWIAVGIAAFFLSNWVITKLVRGEWKLFNNKKGGRK